MTELVLIKVLNVAKFVLNTTGCNLNSTGFDDDDDDESNRMAFMTVSNISGYQK